MERISSRQNALVRRFRQLHGGDPSGERMLLDGEHLVREAMRSGLELDVVAFTDHAASGRLAALAAELAHAGVRLATLSDAVFSAISPVRQPSGIAAIARQPVAIIGEVFRPRPALLLVLNGLQDPGNVGAIVRTAEGCGTTAIVLTPGTADPFGWKALRGGMGSTFRVPIAAAESLDAAVSLARRAGLRVIATTSNGGTPLPDCDLRGDCAVLLGSEGPGLPQGAINGADERITIPMRAPVESFNVAISAALVMYEAARQRTAPERPARRTNVAV